MAQPILLTIQIDDKNIQLRFDNGTGRIYRQLAKIEGTEAPALTFDEIAEMIFVAAYKRAVVYLKIQNALPDNEVVDLYLSTGAKTTIEVISAFNSVMAIDAKQIDPTALTALKTATTKDGTDVEESKNA